MTDPRLDSLEAVAHAPGHVESGKRDHKRLAAHVDVPPPRWVRSGARRAAPTSAGNPRVTHN